MQYRREVDGLRAVAVIPVILFHAGFGIFDGGYAGVDVFFVISGYLIATILIGDLEGGRFSIARFYERRARRILPALFLVMACCIPFAWIWMLPSQFEDFGNSLLFVSLFISNFYFGGRDGYFDPSGENQPLLHTWSLAVEEQYYLVFPLLLALCWRFGRHRLLAIFAILSLLSLATAEAGWRMYPVGNFFFSPARVWELLAGAMIALLPAVSRPNLTNNALSAAGFAMIAAAMLLYDEETPFPSVYALAPVVGTALVIRYGIAGTWTARLLSLPPFVGIGLISYSAYLWHQPLFAFARLTHIGEPPDVLLLGLAAGSLALAYLSWRFVEQPFRKPRSSGGSVRAGQYRVFAASLALGAAFVIFGAVSDNTRYFEARIPEKGVRNYSYITYYKTPDYLRQYRPRQCFIASDIDSFEYFDQDTCLNYQEGKKNYVFLGDSHTAHLWYAVNQAFPEVNVMQASASGCLPVIPYTGKKRCTDLVRFIYEDYLPNHKIDGIILSGRWKPAQYESLPATAELLTRLVPHVIILGPNIEHGADLPLILGAYSGQSAEDLGRLTRSMVRAREQEVTSEMQRILNGTGVDFVPLFPHVCSRDSCRVFSDTGEPLMFDRGHFTLSGAITTVNAMVESGALSLGPR